MMNFIPFPQYLVTNQISARKPALSKFYVNVWLTVLISLFGLFAQPAIAQDNFQVWLRTFNGSGGNTDDGRKVATDNAGNVYVGGTVYSSIANNITNDFIVIKYNTAGTKLWERIYNTGTYYNDRLKDMAVDGAGNVYVTGSVHKLNANSSFLTIKYNSSGTQQWAKYYNAIDEFSTPYDLILDGSGNVYVTGVESQNYLTLKYNSAGTQQWAKTYNNGANSYDYATSVVVDGSGNVYVTGSSAGSAENFYTDYATVKYNSAGTQQWVKRYDGTAGDSNDAARDIAVDGSGNVYVTGTSAGSATAYDDYATVKYNSAGVQQWAKRYNAGSYDQANALEVDGAGNVYVTGHSGTSGENDFVTIKYNTSGTEQWNKRFDGSSEYDGDDYPQDLKLDGSGNVYITGYGSNSANDDVLTVKYNSSGTLLWKQRYQTGGGGENGYSLALDGSGNVYVAGISDYANGFYDIITLKYVNPGNNDIVNSNTSATICSGNYYDNGYTLNYKDDYLNSYQYLTHTLTPATAGSKLRVSFSSFNLVNGQDFLSIYDGPNTSSPIIGAYTGTSSPGTVTATNSGGTLTFQFYRSSASGAPGWVAALSCVSTPVGSQWNKRFGSSSTDNFSTVIKTSDGGYLLGGYSSSGVSGDKTEASRGDYDFWIVKTDAAGNKQWDKRFGGTGADYLNAAIQTSDGGYLIGGNSLSGTGGDKTEGSRGGRDYWVIKLTSNGIKTWDKRFGSTGDEDLRTLIQTAAGYYFLAGYSNSPAGGDKSQGTQGGQDYWVVKLTAAGAKIFDKRYGGSADDFLEGVAQTSDGGYILGGRTTSGISGDKTQASQGGSDYWLVRIDGNGAKIWDKRFGGSGNDDLWSMGRTAAGFFYVAGTSTSGVSGDKSQGSQGGKDYWMLKITPEGIKQWDKRFGGSADDELKSIVQTTDGGYIIGGKSLSAISGDKTQSSRGSSDYWTVKTDGNGIKQWDRRFGGSAAEDLRTVLQTTDGGYLLGGRSDSGAGGDKTQASQGGTDYWIVKVPSNGGSARVAAEETEETVAEGLTLHAVPNPFSDKVTVGFTLTQTQQVNLRIYDSQGHEVKILYQGEAEAQKAYTFDWQPQKERAGMYIIRLGTESKVSTKKIMLTK